MPKLGTSTADRKARNTSNPAAKRSKTSTPPRDTNEQRGAQAEKKPDEGKVAPVSKPALSPEQIATVRTVLAKAARQIEETATIAPDWGHSKRACWHESISDEFFRVNALLRSTDGPATKTARRRIDALWDRMDEIRDTFAKAPKVPAGKRTPKAREHFAAVRQTLEKLQDVLVEDPESRTAWAIAHAARSILLSLNDYERCLCAGNARPLALEFHPLRQRPETQQERAAAEAAEGRRVLAGAA